MVIKSRIEFFIIDVRKLFSSEKTNINKTKI